MYSKAEREEMARLSRVTLGSSSKWQKILNEGVMETVMTTVSETVPGENGEPDSVKETKVPKLLHGRPYKAVRRYTYEELKDMMIKQKENIDKAVAAYQAQQDAAEKAKQDAAYQQDVHKKLKGSAI